MACSLIHSCVSKWRTDPSTSLLVTLMTLSRRDERGTVASEVRFLTISAISWSWV